MTQRIRDRLLNALVSALTAGGAVVLAFTLSSGETKDSNIQEELKEKAPYEYVDSQDNAIRESISDDKQEHDVLHTTEYNATQDQLELIIELIRSQHQ